MLLLELVMAARGIFESEDDEVRLAITANVCGDLDTS